MYKIVKMTCIRTTEPIVVASHGHGAAGAAVKIEVIRDAAFYQAE